MIFIKHTLKVNVLLGFVRQKLVKILTVIDIPQGIYLDLMIDFMIDISFSRRPTCLCNQNMKTIYHFFYASENITCQRSTSFDNMSSKLLLVERKTKNLWEHDLLLSPQQRSGMHFQTISELPQRSTPSKQH